MYRYWKYSVVALVVVALLSVGAQEARERTADEFDATDCGSATLSVSSLDPDYAREANVSYGNLSTEVRAAFDRARATDGTTSIDPAILSDSHLLFRFPDQDISVASSVIVIANGTRYNVVAETSDCPAIAGTPPWINYLVHPLVAIYRVFSPLYLPVGGLLAIVVAYRTVDDWLQFG